MKKYFLAIAFITSILKINGQTSLDFYLPDDVGYDQSIPDPNSFSSYTVGNWHFSHDQILNYARLIADKSDRAELVEYGRSWENRPLVYLIFTAPENHDHLELLRKTHLEAAFNGKKDDKNPLVFNLGYGVHGNESSASNSSLLTMYYLAAAESPEIDKLMKESIILVDPCLNPDGFTRHSTWVNSNQGKNPVSDPNSRGFNEPWPGSRTNHYLFDMNRDYLPLTNPEAEGRIANYHKWLPNIYTDHHEMGANSTFFFQPGVESRNNPLTPFRNYELTKEIASFHAKALDEIGELYFTEERFDDFYYGKGSSYPDINSGIGILFEQAGYRGNLRETSHGLRSFSTAVKNQFTVTLSSLKAGMELKNELLNYQQEFYKSALEEAGQSPVKAYIFGDEYDLDRLNAFVDLLGKHQIRTRILEKNVSINNIPFKAGKAYIVENSQYQFRLIKSLFEPVKTYDDTTFYDVSTWNLPYSFNLQFTTVNDDKILKNLYSGKNIPASNHGNMFGEGDYALLMTWDSYFAPFVLNEFQNLDIRVYVATDQFSIEGKDYSYGTIMIPLNNQSIPGEKIITQAKEYSQTYHIDFDRINTGLSSSGINPGSNSFIPLNQSEIALITGEGTHSYYTGEAWHLLEQRFGMTPTLLDANRIDRVNLSDYNIIILISRRINLSGSGTQQLKTWIENGGVLISFGESFDFLNQNKLINAETIPAANPYESKSFQYSERNKAGDLHRIAGAIYQIDADISHPLFYGYRGNKIPVFKNSDIAIKVSGNPSPFIAKYSQTPLLSGYSSQENVNRISGTDYIIVNRMGRGKVIYLVDNPNFRGVWYGTNKIFMNAILFGQIIR